MTRKISESTVRRLSIYLRVLEDLEGGDAGTLSSRDLAEKAGTTAAQVRKDFSLFGSFGKRGLGYPVASLVEQLRDILGVSRRWSVALIGAGRIGSALFEYANFRERGFDIVAVVDSDPAKIGLTWGSVEIRAVKELETVLEECDADIVILAVPGFVAQEMLDRSAAAGVRGVLNFAPIRLKAPEGVSLKDVNMVMELEALSFALSSDAR